MVTDKDPPETFFISFAYQIHNLDIFGTTGRLVFVHYFSRTTQRPVGFRVPSPPRKSAIDPVIYTTDANEFVDLPFRRRTAVKRFFF